MRPSALATLHRVPLLILLASAAPLWAETVDDTGRWRKHVIHSGTQCVTAVAADFSGDGLPDVITTSENATRLFVAPDWQEVVIGQHPEINSFIHSEVFDVDGDGDADYIGANYNPGRIVWMEQPDQPTTQRWKVHLIDDAVHGIHGLLRGDVDRDGQLDLLATSAQPLGEFPESLVWYRIPPDPRTAARWERRIVADRDAPGLTHYLGLGDVDGDGRPDVATGAKGGAAAAPSIGEYFAWWQAPESFDRPWTKHVISDAQPGATNIHPADINGDGQTDFLAARGHGRGVVWFEGPTWQQHTIHATLQEPHCLVVQDLDGDQDIDAATCAYGDQQAVWFENDGRGNFLTHLIGRDQEAYDIRALDMDNDGDLDLLIAGRGSRNVVWYENLAIQPADR